MKQVLIIMAILTLASCTREPIDVVISKTPIIRPSTQEVIGSITGLVVEENNAPLSGENGIFSFMDIQLYEDGTYLTATKPGYYEGSRKFYASANQTNNISIKLSLKTPVSSFDARNGGIIQIGNASVAFPAGQYLNPDQSPYNGSIDIYGKWLDPTEENTYYEMPGDLTGYDKNGELRALSSFGLLRLEIKNSSDETVEIPDGESMTIQLEVPEALSPYAPESISLLYYSAENNNWIEDGTAELIGDNYIGEVSHVSFWNASSSLPVVNYSGSISFNNELAAGTKIKIQSLELGYTAYALSSDSGTFNGRLPKDVSLEMTVFHECGNKSFQKTIGPLNDSTFDQLINFDVDLSTTAVAGTIKTCPSYTSSDDHYARIKIGSDNYLIPTAIDGSYHKALMIEDCKADAVTSYGLDMTNGLMSQPVHQGVSSLVMVKDLLPCESIETGLDINYGLMDWKDKLNNGVYHKWTLLTISGSETRYILSLSINDINNDPQNGQDIKYLTGAIVFYEDDTTTGTYKLEYPTQGFSVSGECTIDLNETTGSIRITDSSTDIKITDSQNSQGISAADIGQVMMNLVYYL